MARARSLAGFYLKGMPHAAALRQEAMTCNTTKDYLDLAERVLERVGQLDA
jgi:tRNA-dihydrouridine synthase